MKHEAIVLLFLIRDPPQDGRGQEVSRNVGANSLGGGTVDSRLCGFQLYLINV